MDIHVEEKPDVLAPKLPRFEKIAAEALGLGANSHFDLVVRSDNRIPVGMVSKTYRLIQHVELHEAAVRFVSQIPGAFIEKDEADLTTAGERMMLRMDLGKNFRVGPDGLDVGLQLICRNSVDGSGAMHAHLGWFRFVCSNGLLVGVTLGRSRVIHNLEADLTAVFAPLTEQIEVAKADRDAMHKWVHSPVSHERVRRWIDTDVSAKWNSLAACRVWHICACGRDARFVPPFEKVAPSRKSVELLAAVPGAPPRSENLYSVAQALSWVASHRKDIHEAEAFQQDIGSLLNRLKN